MVYAEQQILQLNNIVMLQCAMLRLMLADSNADEELKAQVSKIVSLSTEQAAAASPPSNRPR